MEPLLKHLGYRVRQLREGEKMTRRSLADRSGVSERFLASLEKGDGNVSVLKLESIARALRTNAATLLAGKDGIVGPPTERVWALLLGRTEPELSEVETWLATRFAEPRTRRTIALLGLRGAGKTTLGKELAKQISAPFVELDQLIEARAGLTLAEIFALQGESFYRRLELEALRDFLDREPGLSVLATGGGIVQNSEALDLLGRRTVTVWLKATPEDHWARVVHQGDRRPMRGNPRARRELQMILADRKPQYSTASHTVNTSTLGQKGSVEALRRIAESSALRPS
jgi:XRE family transcriptional regulator, aerobic/anaerobic benzoate catabolism transcriptional regulator